MKIYLPLLSLCLLLSTHISAQEISFYKKERCRKETTQKKAKFKKTEFYIKDTLIIQIEQISDNLLINESKWFNNKAVGTWTKFDLSGNLISLRNFEKLVYSKDEISGIYDATKKNENCNTCKPAKFPQEGTFGVIKYPQESKDMGISGTVYIRFIIDREGNAIPHSITSGVDPFIDIEAWELVEKMSKWTPATKDGEPIESIQAIPIKFTLR